MPQKEYLFHPASDGNVSLDGLSLSLDADARSRARDKSESKGRRILR